MKNGVCCCGEKQFNTLNVCNEKPPLNQSVTSALHPVPLFIPHVHVLIIIIVHK